MKQQLFKVRLIAWSSIIALALSSVSCMTTYDTNGRAMQTVDPAVAIAGVAAAGLIGYAASNNRSSNRRNDNRHLYSDGGSYYSSHCDDYDHDYGYDYRY